MGGAALSPPAAEGTHYFNLSSLMFAVKKEEIKRRENKMQRKIFVLLVASLIVFFLAGCANWHASSPYSVFASSNSKQGCQPQ